MVKPLFLSAIVTCAAFVVLACAQRREPIASGPSTSTRPTTLEQTILPEANGEEVFYACESSVEDLLKRGVQLERDGEGRIVSLKFDSDRTSEVDYVLQWVLPTLKSVRHADFRWSGVTDRGLYYAIRKLPNLKSIDLRSCLDINSDVSEYLLLARNLESVHISRYLGSITENKSGAQELAERLPGKVLVDD